MYLNKVLLYGNLTRDPEVRALPSGSQVTSFGLATNRSFKDKNGAQQEQTEFHNVVLWGRTAEIAGQYLTKGAMVLIEGRLQTRSWTDKTGQQRKTTEVMAERMQLGPRAAGGGQGGGGNFGGGNRGGSSAAPATAPASGNSDNDTPSLDEIPVINLEEDEIKPEDIPF